MIEHEEKEPENIVDESDKHESDLDKQLREYNEKIERKQEPIKDEENPIEEPTEQPKKRGRKPGQKNKKDDELIISSPLITGAMFLMACDFIFPACVSWVYNKTNRDKIDGKLLKLDEDQKKEIEPLAAEVVKQLNLRMSPLMAYALTMSGIYFMNIQKIKLNEKNV